MTQNEAFTENLTKRNSLYATLPAGDKISRWPAAEGKVYPQVAAQSCDMANKARQPSPTEAAEATLKDAEAHRLLVESQILTLHMVMPHFDVSLRQLQEGLFKWFEHQGFWGDGSTICSGEQARLKKMEKLGLIVTEIAECMEGVRLGDRENEAEELADALVRMLDYCGGFSIDLSAAFERKMLKNYQRPFRHNKHF